MKLSLFTLAIAFATLMSCTHSENKGQNKTFLPNITGRNGEVLIVMNETIKNDTSGQYLRAILTEDVIGLNAREPLFDIQSIPAAHLTSEMKTFRNIISVEVADSILNDTTLFYRDNWATPQAYITVRAHSKAALLKTLENNHLRILSYLTKSENDRIIAFNRRTANNAVSKELSDRFGVKIVVPNTFSRCTPHHPDDLSWIMIDTDQSQCGMFMYEYEYTSQDCLSKEYILNVRGKLLRDNIEGPNGSYMCTETRFGLDEITYDAGYYNKTYIAELRGLWRMEGYAMGGPFVLRAHLDAARNRVVVTDGYVYYPSRDRKRNLIRQLEAVMYSLEFPKEETENQ
ncbi:MAG: DUF4837 family protein [Bacteroidales bacterium]|nr:DUF4837 family protein [Bacteroidales bacterium]